METLVQLEAVSAHRGTQQALREIQLTLRQGEIVTLIGPNGGGKTTLAHVVLGLLPVTSGRVWRRAGLRIGYVPQHAHIPQMLPISVAHFVGLGGPELPEASSEALEEMGVAHLATQQVHELSGGEWQRVLLARALSRRPQLLVLDEPMQGVDLPGQSVLFQQIQHFREERGCGILLISHDLHVVLSTTDHVICLQESIRCTGHPSTVRKDPAYQRLFGKWERNALAPYLHGHEETPVKQ